MELILKSISLVLMGWGISLTCLLSAYISAKKGKPITTRVFCVLMILSDYFVKLAVTFVLFSIFIYFIKI